MNLGMAQVAVRERASLQVRRQPVFGRLSPLGWVAIETCAGLDRARHRQRLCQACFGCHGAVGRLVSSDHRQRQGQWGPMRNPHWGRTAPIVLPSSALASMDGQRCASGAGPASQVPVAERQSGLDDPDGRLTAPTTPKVPLEEEAVGEGPALG